MNKEYKEKILKTGLEGFLIGVAIGVAAGIFYFSLTNWLYNSFLGIEYFVVLTMNSIRLEYDSV